MKIKNIKFILCIPIVFSFFFVLFTQWQDCSSEEGEYNSCRRRCWLQCAECENTVSSNGSHVNCDHDCNCDKYYCSGALQAYNTCLRFLNPWENNTQWDPQWENNTQWDPQWNTDWWSNWWGDCANVIESYIWGQSGCVAYTGNGNWWCNTPAGYRLYLENNQEYTKIAESQRMKILLYLQKYNEEHDDKLDIDLTEVGNINSDVISGVQKLLGMTVNSCGSKKTYDTYFQYPFCSSIYSWTNLSAQELNDQGTCDDWFYKDPLYDCCIKYQSFCDMATGYMKLYDGIYTWKIWVVCEPCLAWTKPNDDHSRCVCDSDTVCCGIELYVWIPFIGDCIEMNSYSARPDTTTVTNTSAFPVLMQWLMKIVMSVILVVSFLLVIVSGLMMTAWAFKSTSFDKWKTLIKNVIISLILLWLSWLILKLINPSFFGG